MKNLSSDTAYYRQIGNTVILVAFFIFFATVLMKDSRTGQIIFSCIGGVLALLMLKGLFDYKKITYNSNTLFIKTYLTGKVIEVPLSNVIKIEKGSITTSYSTMRSGRLVFSDGEQTRRIRFYLAYNLYSVINLSGLIGIGMEPSPAFKASAISIIESGLDRGKRIGSAITDQLIMTMVIMVFGIPALVYEFTHIGASIDLNLYSVSGSTWYVYVLNMGIALYFCKDCIAGQSPAKYIFKFQVVNNTTGKIAGPFRCLVRDIFIILWPVEAIMLLANPSRRLGDIIAGTKVVLADAEPMAPKINIINLIIVFILAYPIMPLVGYLSDKLMGR